MKDITEEQIRVIASLIMAQIGSQANLSNISTIELIGQENINKIYDELKKQAAKVFSNFGLENRAGLLSLEIIQQVLEQSETSN